MKEKNREDIYESESKCQRAWLEPTSIISGWSTVIDLFLHFVRSSTEYMKLNAPLFPIKSFYFAEPPHMLIPCFIEWQTYLPHLHFSQFWQGMCKVVRYKKRDTKETTKWIRTGVVVADPRLLIWMLFNPCQEMVNLLLNLLLRMWIPALYLNTRNSRDLTQSNSSYDALYCIRQWNQHKCISAKCTCVS